jgi:hypothetical protein
VGAVIKALESYWGNEISDPAKVAQLILRLAAIDHLPAHLLLGNDAVQYAGQAQATRAAEADRWREISLSTDVDAQGAVTRRSSPSSTNRNCAWPSMNRWISHGQATRSTFRFRRVIHFMRRCSLNTE